MGSPRILDPEIECHSDLWPRQRAALQTTLRRLGTDPVHGARWNAMQSVSLRHPDALAELPFTTKADLQISPPLSDHGVPRPEIIRIHASSGTSGRRTISGYTAADIALPVLSLTQ